MNRDGLLLPGLALMVAMLSIQAGAALARQLFESAGVAGTTALRLILGAAFLLPVLRPWRARPVRPASAALLGYGVTIGVMNLLFYLAVARLPLGIVVAIEFLGPLGVSLAVSRRASHLVWLALAALGILLLTPLGLAQRSADPAGLLFALGAASAWAVYMIVGKRAGLAFGSRAPAIGTLIGACVVGPIGIAQSGTRLLDPPVLAAGAAVALLATAIPFTLELMALTRLPTRIYGVLTSLEPAIAALAGLLILGQRIGPVQWAGIAAVSAASLGATLSARRPEPLIPA
jgi:inner membrane transporter RhtA